MATTTLLICSLKKSDDPRTFAEEGDIPQCVCLSNERMCSFLSSQRSLFPLFSSKHPPRKCAFEVGIWMGQSAIRRWRRVLLFIPEAALADWLFSLKSCQVFSSRGYQVALEDVCQGALLFAYSWDVLSPPSITYSINRQMVHRIIEIRCCKSIFSKFIQKYFQKDLSRIFVKDSFWNSIRNTL